MATMRSMFQIGNLIKYRKHASHDYALGLIIDLTKTTVTLYTSYGKCAEVLKNNVVIQMVSRPYSKVL